MQEYPCENLIRMSTGIRADDVDGVRILTGTPIVFNQWTEISGWEGNFREQIDPGAVDKTLKERGDRVKVLFNHGFDPQIGEKPLGKPSMQEPRSDGLHVKMPFADTSYNADIIALLDAEAIDGMSFRFGVISETWDNLDADDNSLPERTITELRLYEWGPVTFPAYEAATAGIRTSGEYAEYRQRLAFLQSGAAHGAPAASTSGQSHGDTQHEISRLIREINLRIKGIS